MGSFLLPDGSKNIELPTENLTLYEVRTIGFDAIIRELGPAGAIALSNNTNPVMEITPVIARNCCHRNLSTRLADYQTTSIQNKMSEALVSWRGLLCSVTRAESGCKHRLDNRRETLSGCHHAIP